MIFNDVIRENNTSVPHPAVPILIVICGATATGKSRLAMQLAQRLPGVILSADSRQIYRDFNIGTAKPTWIERQQVPHYLIDICSPTETLTLADYQQQTQALIAKFHGEWEQGSAQENREESSKILSGMPGRAIHPESKIQNPKSKIQNPLIPLLVGGTGLYIKSIVRGLLIPRVAPQPELRSQLQALGQVQCYGFLQQVDPVAAARIHANDQVRTLRALEAFYVTGKPISQQQGERPPAYPILQIGLDCKPDALLRRIRHRTAQMIAEGFAAEVESLCQSYGSNLPLLNTLGYQEMKQYLAGECSLKQAEELIVLHTRQFAKQQRTWFRADESIVWFDAEAGDLVEQVWQRIGQFFEGVGI